MLSFRGFPAEESPDGGIPKVWVWRDLDDLAPVKMTPGDYTSYGRARDPLAEADDRFVILGPGDGLSVRVREDRLPVLPEGYRRTFLAKTFGYCKDMDLYTAHPDQVEPLPFRGMSGYPFPDGEGYPRDAAHLQYLAEWNTREVRGRFPRD